MKSMILSLLMAGTMSMNAFAADCAADAHSIAKMNLDQVAAKYGFSSADVVDPAKFIKQTKSKLGNNQTETLSIFTVEGSIYKGLYTLTIAVDETCALRSLTIKDNSTN